MLTQAHPVAVDRDALATEAPGSVRARIRAGQLTSPTAGYARGYVQANLVIMPERSAFDFLRYCQRNPKPCPLLAVGEPGDPRLPALGDDVDVRSDLPGYRVFENGSLTERRHDIADLWRDDLVAFAIGCSFSWEEALMAEGLPLRHVDQGANVSMYRTNIPTAPSGAFEGDLVVSMRPFRPAAAIRAIQITSRFPLSHGAPVHFGDPGAIGVADLARPDYGDPTEIGADETPVFWACGVTPQVAIRNAGVGLCITHEPGCMLITDLSNAGTAVV
jgi:uncharacterized protein YcsI (UPF0317 family)